MTPLVPSVGVFGAGAVGQAVGGALVAAGLCGRLLVTSRTIEQAQALADDLDDMRTALGSPVLPGAAEAEDLRACAAVVIAVRAQFANTRSTDVRMGGIQANAPVVRDLAEQLSGYPGTVLVVTNPVDLMTRWFAEESGCSRVFGIGSSLDSARYRLTLGRLLGVPADAVSGRVIGEHGDTSVVCASSTLVNDQSVPVPLQQVRDELDRRPGRINIGIGRTRCGPAGAVVSALRLALGAEDGTTELCAPHAGDWCGIPVRFTGGDPVPFSPPLDPVEDRQLEASRTKLRAAYQAARGVPLQPSPSGRKSP
ncbi:NAD(P)-binding domain-containing protein (plasmid) [Streptomyces coelicoflavus]|uniref:lactate/malate family dehydrogenase n=1 Tax=Streptomyces coelicoflavus TaxID=285562 RepID=UPI002F907A20